MRRQCRDQRSVSHTKGIYKDLWRTSGWLCSCMLTIRETTLTLWSNPGLSSVELIPRKMRWMISVNVAIFDYVDLCGLIMVKEDNPGQWGSTSIITSIKSAISAVLASVVFLIGECQLVHDLLILAKDNRASDVLAYIDMTWHDKCNCIYECTLASLVVSRASRSTSGLGGKERLVTFARYSWALPKCWQSQSDCTAAKYDVTSHGLPY